VNGTYFLAFAFIAIVGTAAYAHLRARLYWKSKPTLSQYLAKNPSCQTDDKGIRCNACGSGSLKNWGIGGPADIRRLFICNHCGSELYRTDQ